MVQKDMPIKSGEKLCEKHQLCYWKLQFVPRCIVYISNLDYRGMYILETTIL